MGQIIKSVCVCLCQSVSQCICQCVRTPYGHYHGRISRSIITKIGTDVRTPNRKNEFIRSQYCTTPSPIAQNLHFRPRGPENPLQCPCSIFCDSVTLIYACIIIIIIIIIIQILKVIVYLSLKYRPTRIAEIFASHRKFGSR